MINTKRLAATLLGTVRDWVEPAIRSMGDRLDEFDTRLKSIPAGPVGANGIDGMDGAPGPQGTPGRDGIDGKDGASVHPDTIARMVSEAARSLLAEIPQPRDGANGADGRDADPVLIEKLVQANVAHAIAALPKPQDGAPGRDGRDADPDFVRAQIMAIVESIPTPVDGKDGAAGADGRDADPALVHQAVADAAADMNRELVEFADELLRGLEGDASALPAAPSVAVHVGDTARQSAGIGIGAREHTVITNRIAEMIEKTLRMPVKPVYDASGKLIYAQRVETVDAD